MTPQLTTRHDKAAPQARPEPVHAQATPPSKAINPGDQLRAFSRRIQAMRIHWMQPRSPQ